MSPVRTATLVALACIPLLGACDRSTPPAPQDAEAPATSLGKVVDEATEKARIKLANEPITLSSDDGKLPKAEIDSAVRISPQRLAELVDAQWVDVCQELQTEAC